MKLETERVLAQPLAAAHPGWRAAGPALAGCIALILAIYWPTVDSIVSIWERSETFAHGYLIVPITLWLVWLKRREIARLAPVRDYLGLLFLAGAAAAWLAASAGQVQVVQQYALALMIPAAVVALAGRRIAAALAFPLAFLLLGVPVGEALIPPLMAWTADFTVAALQLTGIPVYREGLFFTIPSGNWSVVEACSGLRYLIASVTVGLLFAYLNYRKLWKRALFVAAAIALPIFANGLRAYGIVMIAHLSDMQLAMGVDHFIYGWVFFGLVMLLLFWLGSFWRDEPASQAKEGPSWSVRPVSAASVAIFALAVIALAGSAPAYAKFLEAGKGAPPSLAAPAGANGWTLAATPLTDWRPRYQPASAGFFQVYEKEGLRVALYLGYYRGQRPGAQLVTSTNVMVEQKHPVWSNVGEAARTEGPLSLRQTRLRSPEQRLLVWDWLWISGEHLSSPYLAKLYLARDKLLGRGDDGAAIILAAPYGERAEPAQEALREFARDMLPSIEAALHAARRTP